MKRILGLLGWAGVVLVLAALVLRFTRPDLNIHPKLALAGLVVTAVYTLSQWRDIVRSFKGRGVKYGSVTAGSVALVLGILDALDVKALGGFHDYFLRRRLARTAKRDE